MPYCDDDDDPATCAAQPRDHKPHFFGGGRHDRPAVLVANGIDAWWLVPPLAVVMTGVALRRRPASDQKNKGWN
jgi:hypothetical protein